MTNEIIDTDIMFLMLLILYSPEYIIEYRLYSPEKTWVYNIKTHTKNIMIIEHIGIDISKVLDLVPKYHTLEQWQTWPRSSVGRALD